MHLEACFTSEDFKHVLAQLTPLSVLLDPDSPQRRLSVEPPSSVSIVPGRGLRIVTEVQLQWDVIGLRVPVTLRRVSLLLTPSIMIVEGKQALSFGLRIEEADVSAIPAFVGGAVIGLVNDALAKEDARMSWRFMETLNFKFGLPAEIQPPYGMHLYARSGTVQVEQDSVRLSVAWMLTAAVQPSSDT